LASSSLTPRERIRDVGSVLDETLEKLAAIENDSIRAARASAVFGEDAGPRLAAALGKGINAMNELRRTVPGLISDDQVAKAAALTDEFGRMATTLGGRLNAAFIDAAAAAGDFLGIIDRDRVRMENFGEASARLRKRIDEVTASIAILRGASPIGGGGLDSTITQLEAQRARLQRVVDVGITPFAQRRQLLGQRAAHPQLGRITVSARPIRQRPELFDVGEVDRERSARLAQEAAERAEEVRTQLVGLEEQALRSQVKMAEAIRLAADEQIRQWERVAEETPALADEAAQAIALINQRTVAEIEALHEKAGDKMKKFAESFAATFESRGVDALLSGKLREAVRGLTRDFAELVIRLTVIRPLAEAVAEAINKIGKDKEEGGSGILGSILGSLGGGSVFGGSRATGGRVTPGKVYRINDPGPELFSPDVPGRILSAAQTARLASSGGTVNVGPFYVQAGLPPQWEAQLSQATEFAASAAYEAVERRLGGRR
jgi:hypothetical protein